jgi:hypothetical protein
MAGFCGHSESERRIIFHIEETHAGPLGAWRGEAEGVNAVLS